MTTTLSERGQRSFSAYNVGIPEVTNNIYDEESNPSGVISLALSENHLIHGHVVDFINKHFKIDERTATTYTGSTIGGVDLRKAVAKHINKYFNPVVPVDVEEVGIANGVTAICSMLAFILGDVGDGILLMRPIYGKFENDFTIVAQYISTPALLIYQANEVRCKTLYANMDDTDPFSEAVVEKYAVRLAQAKTDGTNPRALLICNPHNPSGRCYPKSSLIALMKFCAQNNLHLISDEIYALTVFETDDPSSAPFTSVLEIDTAGIIDSRFVHVEYGFSKDFGAPGLHIAVLITRNEEVQQAFKAIGLIHAPGGPSCAIALAMLEDNNFVENTIKLSRTKLAENYELVTRMLDTAGITYWKGGRAGFFLWMDLSRFLPPADGGQTDTEREKNLTDRLLEGGVFLNAGAEWAERPGWFRLIFSDEKGKVEEGVRR
ncbi:hypothetical protein VE03_02044 [Pseudogymnoascus sp. 23342-1-I1]|nr:hypothetical protein VE03_02044 [Pseudogymnoascus sp. 23342-1-I1]